jgi:hypothetical protein
VTFELTDATLSGGGTKGTVTTDDNGTATVSVMPTDTSPKLVSTLTAPTDRPYVQAPVDVDTQRVVSTGGERELTAEDGVSALTKPGSVRVTKLDADSHKGIAGAELRLTGKDKASPATGQDGDPRTGQDGGPAVLTTEGDEGAAVVENLHTPQEICFVEVRPPAGYDNAFTAAEPPSACGTVRPGETLELAIANIPNEVPTVIPAGAPPSPGTLHAATTTVTSPAGFAVTGGLALLGSALVGALARRRLRK